MTEIEVFADVSCPFTQAGLHRWFDRRDAAALDGVHLRVRAWPLEVVNGTPLTGEAISGKVAALGEAFPELFAEFDPASFPRTTLPALQLTNVAYRVGSVVGERVATDLRDLVFMRGIDISDPDVLAEVARHHGLSRPGPDDVQAVYDDLEDGRRRGVIGSPHYFGPGFDAFCPGLDIDHVGEQLDIGKAGDRFEEFIDRCFATSE